MSRLSFYKHHKNLRIRPPVAWRVGYVVLVVGIGAVWAQHHARKHAVDYAMLLGAREYGVPLRLVTSVAWKESRHNPQARGAAGEIGLMQIMPPTGADWARATGLKDFTPDALWDPYVNARAGSWYLARGLEHWKDHPTPEAAALAQYNAGRTHALRWARAAESNGTHFVENITFPGTRQYVLDVLENAGLRNPSPAPTLTRMTP